MDLKLTFSVPELPFFFISHKNGRKTLDVQAFDGMISAAVPYDHNRRPLELKGDIRKGDTVVLVLLAHRIELYVNGVLMDEEWPAGNRFFASGDEFIPAVKVQVEDYSEKAEEIPAVISTFENAEGWYPGNGVFVGDCMPYQKDGEYHVLYLKDRHHHQSKWGLGAHQWEHISTVDFKTWHVHPMAVPITDPREGSICTGSWIRDGKTEYLYYTVRRGGGLPAPICRSVSHDGYHFEKDVNFGFIVSDQYHAASARDPKVVRGEDGVFHMFLTTSLVKESKGCLAHYVSTDMQKWVEMDAPIYVSADEEQPECPDYFAYRGKYYLVVSLRGKAHYMVSDKPFEGFVMPKDSVIPCASVPKGAEWGGRLVFAGFNGIDGYGGAMTFKAATADETGKLHFTEF